MTAPGGESDRAHPIESSEVLRYARRVCEELPDLSEAGCRRVVSTAYFALFHALTLRAAELLAPSEPQEAHYRLARRFEHRDLRNVALWVTGAGTPPPALAGLVVEARRPGAAATVAEAFLTLYDVRVDADYNHFALFTQERALDLIDDAEGAHDLLTAPSFPATAAGRAFLRLLAEQAGVRP